MQREQILITGRAPLRSPFIAVYCFRAYSTQLMSLARIECTG